jgi:CubicO group peptidase (beta-lactamase class C family)
MKSLLALSLLSLTLAFAQTAPKIDGIWLGSLSAGGQTLRVQVHTQTGASGQQTGSLDSLDQGAMGLPCEKLKLAGDQFSFEVPAVKGTWKGTVSADGNELRGIWSQGAGELALNMTRQAAALGPAKSAPKYEDAKAPVALDDLKKVLDADLASVLAPNGGAVIGVVQHGKRKVFAYGPVKEDSIFEIGSISKTFTGLILAQMVDQHKVSFSDPVRDLLPPGTVAKPAGAEITLLDLATQHSGLPRLPDNLAPKNMKDPYVDYGTTELYAFLNKHGVAKPDNATFLYSNLGFGLLGQALANKSGMTYAQLLNLEVTEPLGLHDTVINLSADQEKRFAQGHDGSHADAEGWNLNSLQGAGGIRSTANDMLTYLEAQLHPSDSLKASIQSTHELRADSLPGMKIGLAWLYDPKISSYWHNGATGGYSSYALFSPREDYAVVILYNTSIGPSGSFADQLGEHVAERMSGRPVLILQ